MAFLDRGISSTEFDEKFQKFPENRLQYYPWIGKKYSNSNQKILIVGESHYAEGNNQSEKTHKDTKLTRVVIEKIGIDREYRDTKTFKYFHLAMMGNDSFDSGAFWESVAFYNFIQRPMFSLDEKPSLKDFTNGWDTFFKTIDIIEPTTVIFIGVSASNYLHRSISKTNYSLKNFSKKKVTRTYSRDTILIEPDKTEIKLTFIQHSGHHFSWQKWNNHLNECLSPQLDWLRNCVYKQ